MIHTEGKTVMKSEEVKGCCNIPEEMVELYERLKLEFAPEKTEKGDLSCEDMERIGLMTTLKEAGLDDRETERYMRLLFEGESTENRRMDILNDKRERVLGELHRCQRRLDKLDYLRYSLRHAK